MAIIGVEGGIGTGKTLTLVYYGLKDLYKGKQLYSNITFKGLGKHAKNVTYLTKEELKNMLNLIKDRKFKMKNSTVLIQEAHNYIDSRTSMFKDNRMISYWILQSRHTGEGSCDIIYDTQDVSQVDKRLRMNTDFLLRPTIVEREVYSKIPKIIYVAGYGKVGHKQVRFAQVIDIRDTLNKYDTHEIVEF